MQAAFAQQYTTAALMSAVALAGWFLLRSRFSSPARVLPLFGILMVADLLSFGFDRNVQSDPALYYPRLPVLEEVAKATPGRVIGYGCFPASVGAISGLRQICGYDGIDPARLLDLMTIANEPGSLNPNYASMLRATPKASIDAEGNIQLSPVLDMLGVRYVIFRQPPPPNAKPDFTGPDYWVLANPRALPRAFVPQRAELIADPAEGVRKLSAADFDPRAVAYVETPANLEKEARGSAEIVSETPTRLTLSLRMETDGLVVLADLWDKGWRAKLDGRPATIIRTDHALRGVVAPAGSKTIEFYYEPASFSWGLRLAGVAAVGLVIWLALLARHAEHEAG